MFTLSPSGIATKVIKTHWVRSTTASLKTLPKRIAERFTGVTRNLSITPDLISSIRLNPTNAEPKSAIITKSPGIKICTVFPAGRPGTPPRPFKREIGTTGAGISSQIQKWDCAKSGAYS
jgi:hypothetical protein